MYNNNHIRGSIKYPDRYKQLISFEGLERHRKITPTDIDGLIDYAGNAFLYMECKLESKYFNEGIDFGQKKAIENLIESQRMSGCLSIAIIFTHNCNPDEIIIAKDQIVREVYFNHKWKCIKEKNWTVLKAVRWFENYCKKQNIYI
jgi:hypothetical protein